MVDDGGNLMALERIDGTFVAGAAVSMRKARTAVLFTVEASWMLLAARNEDQKF